jgi:hypothetical protein
MAEVAVVNVEGEKTSRSFERPGPAKNRTDIEVQPAHPSEKLYTTKLRVILTGPPTGPTDYPDNGTAADLKCTAEGIALSVNIKHNSSVACGYCPSLVPVVELEVTMLAPELQLQGEWVINGDRFPFEKTIQAEAVSITP